MIAKKIGEDVPSLATQVAALRTGKGALTNAMTNTSKWAWLISAGGRKRLGDRTAIEP